MQAMLSRELSAKSSTEVENKFIKEFMPFSDGDFVKVYLYIKYLAASGADVDIASALQLPEETVNAAIDHWCVEGLMSRESGGIRLMSTSEAELKIRKFDKDKYKDFNIQVNAMLNGRVIMPNEYNEYYSVMESMHIEWQAMAAVIGYCVRLKGENISSKYIITVARNLADEGCRTFDTVSDRLEQYGVYYDDLGAILTELRLSKKPDHEAIVLYKKWTKEYKFDQATIIKVAGRVKRGGVYGLDALLSKYNELNIKDYEKIAAYEDKNASLKSLAKKINSTLGIYYENVEAEINTYIDTWTTVGFSDEALIAIAKYCMENDLKSLNDMEAVVKDFFNRSALSVDRVKQVIKDEQKHDGLIADIMKTLGLRGGVKPVYRRALAVWKDEWNVSDELITEAANSSSGKTNPFGYMSAILSSWHKNEITTVGEVAAARDVTVGKVMSAEEVNAALKRDKAQKFAEAASLIDAKHKQREDAVLKRLYELCKAHPAIKECRERYQSGLIDAAIGKNVDVAALKAAFESSVSAAGANIADLEVEVDCKKCNDTGYCDGKYCSCVYELAEKL